MSGTVVFAVAPDVPPADHAAVLAAVAAVPGVASAERLLPGTSVPELLRLGVAQVQQDADPRLVAPQVAAVAGIEYADVPAERGGPWP